MSTYELHISLVDSMFKSLARIMAKTSLRASSSSLFRLRHVLAFVFFVLIFCINGKVENGNVTEAFGQFSSSSPTFLVSSNIYYVTSEGRNSRIYRTLNKQEKKRGMDSSPKTTQVKAEISFEVAPKKSNFTSPSAMIMLANKMGRTKKVIHRFRRQIVPLPRRTMKTKNGSRDGDLSISPETQKLINVYQTFIIDYAFRREWNSAQFILPRQVSLKVCQYFTLAVLLSKASLNLNCSNGLHTSDFMKTDLRQPTIFADFIAENKSNKNNHTIFLVSKLLTDYSSKRKVLLLMRNKSVDEIVNSVRPEIMMNYKWTLVRQLPIKNGSDDEQLEIYKVFGFATSFDPLFQKIGTWNRSAGLQIDSQKDTGIVNFEGRMLRVTTVAGPPVVNLHRPVLGSIGIRSQIATGYLPDILDLMSIVLNFKYFIRTPTDGKFGDLESNGNWSGMVGMLQRNEADIALMSFSLTKNRLSVMDFSPPVEYSSTRLLIRRDWQLAELKLDAFIRPFDWQVWLSIFVLIGLGTFTLIIFTRFRLFNATPGESMWLLSSCFLLQGQSEHTTIRVTPYRIAVGTFWILAVFMFACYTARLTSFLAADTNKLPVKDLNEAVRSNAWKIGLVKGSSFLEKVKESKSNEMTLLWKRLQADSSVLVNGFSDGIQKVYKERYIFFTSESIPTFMVKGNCSYAWLPGKYFPGFGYMGYQKGLPYSSTISHKLSKIRETGLMRRTFKKWWGATSSCNGVRTGSDAFTAISLHETGSAFLVLLFGACIAVVLGVIEFTLSTKRENLQGKTENSIVSDKEFAAPIVQGTVGNLLPILMHYDRSFIWGVEDKVGLQATAHYATLKSTEQDKFYNYKTIQF